jgi:hypothetical protein
MLLQSHAGKLEKVTLHSLAGNRCKLRYGQGTIEFDTDKGQTYTFDGALKKTADSAR